MNREEISSLVAKKNDLAVALTFAEANLKTANSLPEGKEAAVASATAEVSEKKTAKNEFDKVLAAKREELKVEKKELLAKQKQLKGLKDESKASGIDALETEIGEINAAIYALGGKKFPKSPLLRLVFAQAIHTSKEEQNTEIDMLRYRDNKLGTTLGYIAMLCFILAFCILYSTIKVSSNLDVIIFGFNSSGVWVGIDIFINIIYLLFLFLAITELKVYSRVWGYITIGMGAFQIIRLFFYPLALLQGGSVTPIGFTWQAVLYTAAGAFLIFAGIVTVILHEILARYLKTVKAIENERLAK